MYLTLLWPRKWILSFISHEQINLLDQCPELGPDILSVYGLNVFWSTKGFSLKLSKMQFTWKNIHFNPFWSTFELCFLTKCRSISDLLLLQRLCSSLLQLSEKQRNESGSKMNLCPFKRSDTISKILLDSLIRKAFPFNFDQRKSSTFARKSWLELEQTE